MAQSKESFWITNISNRNVTLSDLNLNVKAYCSINLLDSKHYKYTMSQLIASSTSGSIFKKKSKILLREQAPETEKPSMLFNRDNHIPSRERSVLVIKEESYEELSVGDNKFAEEEKFARENADIADMDTKPIFVKVPHAIQT